MGNPLPPDESGEIKSDLAAMRRDARDWDAAADRMGHAALTAGGLTLSGHDFSKISEETGLADAYTEIQQWASGLLDGAHTNLANMAKALRKAAGTYEQTDASGAQRFTQLDRGN